MAVQSGTATNFADLYTQLITFLTTGIGGGQDWTIIHGYERHDESMSANPVWDTNEKNDNRVVLKGEGLGVDDPVYVGLYTYTDPSNSIYTISSLGMVTFDANFKFNNQPSVFQQRPKILCWDQAMPYWFVANGRRFMVLVKTATSYEFLYCGFMLPYCLPDQYPYPYVVGGMANSHISYLNTTTEHENFMSHYYAHAGCWHPSNVWRYLCGAYVENTLIPTVQLYPNWVNGAPRSSSDWATRRIPVVIKPDFGGQYHLQNIELISGTYDQGTGLFGCLDGVYMVSGFQNAPENIIQVDGLDYLVFIDSTRTELGRFFAMRIS